VTGPMAGDGEVRLLANCAVGLGFSYRGFRRGLEYHPHAIGCDAGSADYGPAFLGSGRDPKSRVAVERDLSIMLEGAYELGIPLILGSCGGAGGRTHVAGYQEMIGDIAKRRGMRFTAAIINASQDPASIRAALADARVRPLGPVPALDVAAIDASTEIVAMMGAGPVLQALAQGADVVLAGRCADAAIFAGPALGRGAAPAPAWHAAKVIDKGYLATVDPAQGSPVLATISDEGFVVEPTKPGARCSTDSVAKQTLYENPNPFRITVPEGDICVDAAEYEQLDDRRVRVTGSRFEPADNPTVKLEGARQLGFRAVLVAGIRDPRILEELDAFIEEFRGHLHRSAGSLGIEPDTWSVRFRCYGRDAILGELEPHRTQIPHEVGLIVDVVAQTQDIATALATRAGPAGSKATFKDRLGGGGNLAYPFSPNVLVGGAVYEWSIWHLLEVTDPASPFNIELFEV
jgi:hypothetical protein